jgi:hypothetical protein
MVAFPKKPKKKTFLRHNFSSLAHEEAEYRASLGGASLLPP